MLTAFPARSGDMFGASLALHNETALIGVPYGDEPRGKDTGLVYVYERNAGPEWSAQALLQAGDARQGNLFGSSIALNLQSQFNRERAVIGASGTGSAYLFIQNQNDRVWIETDRFALQENAPGILVVLGKNTAFTGSRHSGAVSVLTIGETDNWQLTTQLTMPELPVEACFSCSLALDNTHLIVGAPQEERTGAIYIYDRFDVETNVIHSVRRPLSVSLYNYPNPFRSATTITFDVPSPQHVHLSAHDVVGRLIDVLVDEVVHAGQHNVLWIPSVHVSGLYTYRLSSENFIRTGWMTRIR